MFNILSYKCINLYQSQMIVQVNKISIIYYIATQCLKNALEFDMNALIISLIKYPSKQNLIYIIHQSQIANMSYLQATFQCWSRQDNNHMFDFTQKSLKKFNIQIYQQGSIFRHICDYSIIFVKRDKVKQFNEKKEYQFLAQIKRTGGQNFLILDKKTNQNEILYKMAQSENQSDTIIENDMIKIGKIRLLVQKIVLKSKIAKNYYQRNTTPTICVQSTSQEIVQTQSAMFGNPSLIQQAQLCKYCYSKNAQKNNPLLSVCLCQGSSKYIHVQCLVTWIKKRPNFSMNEEKGVCSILKRNLTCEVCKGEYNAQKIYKLLINNDNCEFAIIRMLGQNEQLFFLNLQQKPQQLMRSQSQEYVFKIGRNSDNDIIINQLTVSRNHSQLIYNITTKSFTIIDQNSKFGTGIQNRRNRHNQITTLCKYQKGRTVMTFNKINKKSFLPAFLGFFCKQKENLWKQQKVI